MSSKKRQWSVAEAKAKFSELVDEASAAGPQIVTRNGQPAAVVVSYTEWQRRTRRKETLGEFFARSPLRGVDIEFDRKGDKPRKTDL